MLKATHQLSKVQLEALQILRNTCQVRDGMTIPVYPHLLRLYRTAPPSLLYYHQEKLVAFLAFFHFYPDAAEIALLVHPNHRRQGLGKMLWEGILKIVATQQPSLNDLIISTPQSLKQPWLQQFAFKHCTTEHDMQYESTMRQSIHPPPPLPDTCYIAQATEQNIEQLHHIDMYCFQTKRANPLERIKQLLNTTNLKILLLIYKKQPIGQACLFFEKSHVRLTDLAILPKMQHKGFGEILLIHCLQYAKTSHAKKIMLTVAANNYPALQLYQQTGFQIYNTVDYYKRPFSLDRF